MADDREYFTPLWDDFDGELFQDLVCDLLSAEEYSVEASGVGPDGGIDAFATQNIKFGYNSPEPFVWAIACKFRSGAARTIGPQDIGVVLNMVHNERFKSRAINGYFLATNVRLSTNLMSELRGLHDAQPGFKTTYWDRSRLHDALNRHYHVFKKYFATRHPGGLPPASVPPSGSAPPSLHPLAAFEALIHSPNTREVELQAFFESHPSLLTGLPGGVSRILFSPRLGEGRLLRPDIILRPALGDRWSIVELKRPMVEPVVQFRGGRGPSTQLLAAISQLRSYREYFRQSPDEVKQQFGADIREPRLVVVIGRGNAGPDEVAQLRSSLSDVEILTYDDILQFAKRQVEGDE